MRANVGAEAALRSFMTPEQQECYDHYSHFFVVTRAGRVYALTDGYQVIEMHNGLGVTSFHVYAVSYWIADDVGRRRLSMHDSMLAQMLMLQTNPGKLLSIACRNGCLIPYSQGCPPMTGYKIREEGPR